MRRKQRLLLGSDNSGPPPAPSRSPRRGEPQRDEQMIWEGADYVEDAEAPARLRQQRAAAAVPVPASRRAAAGLRMIWSGGKIYSLSKTEPFNFTSGHGSKFRLNRRSKFGLN